MLTLQRINAFRVIRPLLYQFTTSFSTREFISHIIIRCGWETEGKQIVSWGESTTHSEPFYNGEYDQTALCFYSRVCPSLVGQTFGSPGQLHMRISEKKHDRQNRFAIAALDLAFHDAFAKAGGMPLNRYLAQQYRYPADRVQAEVPVGISRGIAETPEHQAQAAAAFIGKGHRKIKLKIIPGRDLEYVRAVREILPADASLYADANTSYDSENPGQYRTLLDMLPYLDVLEQPFGYSDIWDHAKLITDIYKRGLSTVVCLDESIREPSDAELLLEQVQVLTGAPITKWAHLVGINIKLSRLGGLAPAMQLAHLCRDTGMQVMPGGMHEFDIGQGAVVAFESLTPDFYPGDTEGSETYFPAPLTVFGGKPFTGLVTNANGKLTVPTAPGIGTGDVDMESLEKIGRNTYIVSGDASSGHWSPPWHPSLLEDVKKDITLQDGELEFTANE